MNEYDSRLIVLVRCTLEKSLRQSLVAKTYEQPTPHSGAASRPPICPCRLIEQPGGLCGSDTSRIVKKLALRAGLDPAKYAGHGLRAGHANVRCSLHFH